MLDRTRSDLIGDAPPSHATNLPRVLAQSWSRAILTVLCVAAIALLVSSSLARADGDSDGDEAAVLADYESEHFTLESDLDPDFCEQILDHMERVFGVYTEILPMSVPDTSEHKLRLKIFAALSDFQNYHREYWGEDGRRINFVYHHLVDPTLREVNGYWKPIGPFWASLQHETFHAYYRATVAYPPQWLNEGIAEYLEATVFPEDDDPRPDLHRGWVKQLRELVLPDRSKYRRVPLLELLQMTKQEWIREQGATYGESWAFAYWLRHVRDGGRELLRHYLEQLEPEADREENTRLGWDNTFTEDGNPTAPDMDALASEFDAWLDDLTLGEAWTEYRTGRGLPRTRNDDRIRHFERAVEGDPEFYAAHFFLAYSLNEAGEYERALAHAEQALWLFPEYTSAMEAAITAAVALDRHEVAEYWLGQLAVFSASALARVSAQQRAVESWRADNPDAPRHDANPAPTSRIDDEGNPVAASDDDDGDADGETDPDSD